MLTLVTEKNTTTTTKTNNPPPKKTLENGFISFPLKMLTLMKIKGHREKIH